MPSNILCTLGHIASARQLASRGFTPRKLRAAIELGSVTRPRRGTYACAHLDTMTADAARVGGAVACISVLREALVWAGHDTRLHLQLAPNAARLLDLLSVPRSHWVLPQFSMETRWRVGRMQALWQAMHCLDEENAIAAMESAIHTKFLSVEEVKQLAELAPLRLRNETHELVANSGSGNETIVRRRLTHIGYRVEPQGYVPGVGHQDLVVEDCVGLEVDSRAWHSGEQQREIDYERDLHAAGLGRRTLRILPGHIHHSWLQTLAVITRAVADAQQERDRRSGRMLVAFGDPV